MVINKSAIGLRGVLGFAISERALGMPTYDKTIDWRLGLVTKSSLFVMGLRDLGSRAFGTEGVSGLMLCSATEYSLYTTCIDFLSLPNLLLTMK